VFQRRRWLLKFSMDPSLETSRILPMRLSQVPSVVATNKETNQSRETGQQ